MSPQADIYDLAIVGAGPNGLSCAIAAQQAGLSTIILDKGAVVDAIRRFPIDMQWFSTAELLEIGNIPFPAINPHPTRQESLKYYHKVASHFDLNILTYCHVDAIEPAAHDFIIRVTHNRHQQIQARNVVVATGYYDYPNHINVPGEDLPHVHHYYTEAYAYIGQQVLVVGGQNSAVDTALDLYRNGVNVSIVHHDSDFGSSVKYWILPNIKNRVREGSITGHFNATVKAITSTHATIESLKGGTQDVPADHIFIMTGYRPSIDLLVGAGVNVDTNTLIPEHHPDTFETNVPKFYVCGSTVSGRFTNKIFIENGRLHGAVIVDGIVGKT